MLGSPMKSKRLIPIKPPMIIDGMKISAHLPIPHERDTLAYLNKIIVRDTTLGHDGDWIIMTEGGEEFSLHPHAVVIAHTSTAATIRVEDVRSGMFVRQLPTIDLFCTHGVAPHWVPVYNNSSCRLYSPATVIGDYKPGTLVEVLY